MRRVLPLILVLAACSSPAATTASTSQPATAHRTTTTYAPAPGTCKPDTYEPCQALTPGSLNPQVTQATIGTTICVKGWTSTVRPPQTVTGPLKTQAARAYGYKTFNPGNYEGDHDIPLELGGNPEGTTSHDISNFWDEPRTINGPDGKPAGYPTKDRLENYLRAQVCAGKLTLAVAQHQIATDWYATYNADGRP